MKGGEGALKNDKQEKGGRDEVDVFRACVFIYLPYILKDNVEFRRK